MSHPPHSAPTGTGDPNGRPDPAQGQPPEYRPMPTDGPEREVFPEGKTNPLAVAALIFGLTGCLSFFGLVLGVTSLRQIKRDRGKGRGFAIAGIVLGGVINGTAAILVAVSFIVGS
jgi:hypothetical protein